MEHWLVDLCTNKQPNAVELQATTYFSFRKLVYQEVYFICKDPAFSEDVTHEALIKILLKSKQLTCPTGNLKAWVRRIARNTAYDLLKKNRKYLYVLDGVEATLQATLNDLIDHRATIQEVEIKVRNEALLQALNELKPDYRAVLYSYYIEEKSYKEIANEMLISTSVLTQRIARARKKLLQQFLHKWGEDE